MPVLLPQILKTFFAAGSFPSAIQFESLIDSQLNRISDRALLGLKQFDTSLAYLQGDTVVNNQSVFIAVSPTGPGVFDPTAWSKIAGPTPGAIVFKGTWKVPSNDPDLGALTTMQNGDFYVVSEGGTRQLGNADEWDVGDWAMYSSVVGWEKVDNTGSISDGQNLGSGYEIFAQKSGTLLQFRTLTNNNQSILITESDDGIDLKMHIDNITPGDNQTYSSLKIQSELDNKTNKLLNVLGDNLVAIDSSGNLLDSTKNVNSFLWAGSTFASDIQVNPVVGGSDVQSALVFLNTNKANIVSGNANNFSALNGAGQLVDSGFNGGSFLQAGSTYATSIQVLPTVGNAANVQDALVFLNTNKINTVTGATDKIPIFTSGGMLISSGKTVGSFLQVGSTFATSIQVSPTVGGTNNVQDALVFLNSKQASAIAVNPTVGGTNNVQDALTYLDANKVAEGGFVDISVPSPNTGDVLVHTFPNLAGGDYYVEWYYEIAGTNSNTVNKGSVTVAAPNLTPPDPEIGSDVIQGAGSSKYVSVSGFQKINFTQGNLTVTINVTKDSGNGSTIARRVRIRLMKP